MSSRYLNWAWLRYESASYSRFETFWNAQTLFQPEHYFNPNTMSTRTLFQPEHFFNLKIFGLRAKFEKFERTLELFQIWHLEKILKIWADPRIVSNLTLRKNYEKMTENGYLKRVIVAPATDKLVEPQVFQIWHLEKIRQNWADPRIKVTSNEWPADTLTEQRYLKRVIVTPATEIRAFINSWKCV